MKANLIILLLVASLLPTAVSAQKPASDNGEARIHPDRITFMLKNTLGYHRMFLVQGPGIAYGFTMNKRETVPCNWPVGSKLYFTQDGKTSTGLILTVTAGDEGKTLTTDTGASESKPVVAAVASAAKKNVTIRLHNPSLLPRKIALISYEPGETGNGTSIFVLRPKGTTSFRFPVGTKLYTADKGQVDVVMSGKRIDNDKPFLTVKAEDAGKAFDVN